MELMELMAEKSWINSHQGLTVVKNLNQKLESVPVNTAQQGAGEK